jgi:transposase
MTKSITMAQESETDFIGLDLSDKTGTYVVLSVQGEVLKTSKVKLTKLGLQRVFGARPAASIAIEVGGHSPWVSRVLTELGYEVTVANPRQVKLVSGSRKKNDKEDAQTLARLLRLDPILLHAVNHRGPDTQADLASLRSRDKLVRTRTQLISSVRSQVKALGGELPRCATDSFHLKAEAYLPQELLPALKPMLQVIAGLTEQIGVLTKHLEKLADKRYPQTRILRQVKGVGPITSLSFMLTLEQAERFTRSRAVGCFLGLTSRQYDSGQSHPQLGISKAGDRFLRRLLIQSAQYMLGPFGEDCDLRRWGLKLMRGGSNKILKKKAVVAVARKLAVLLHRLWSTGEVYEPLRLAQLRQEAA